METETIITKYHIKSIQDNAQLNIYYDPALTNEDYFINAVSNYDGLIAALKEIAVPYPETNNAEQDHILCKYLIAIAQDAISKTEKNKDL